MKIFASDGHGRLSEGARAAQSDGPQDHSCVGDRAGVCPGSAPGPSRGTQAYTKSTLLPRVASSLNLLAAPVYAGV